MSALSTQDSKTMQTLDGGQAAGIWGPAHESRVEVGPVREQLEALMVLDPWANPQGTSKFPGPAKEGMGEA